MPDLSIEVPMCEVRRFLGYPPGAEARPASRRCLEALDALSDRCRGQLHPRGAYRIIGRDEALAIGMPHAGERVGVAVCTVGAELEQMAAALARENRLVEAMVADAYGSAAAEAAADALEAIVVAETPAGLFRRRRVSPGYGAWNVSWQRALLDRLSAAEVGVYLTAASMMVPRKSVSFAVSFEETPGDEVYCGHGCDDCGMTACPHRRTR